MAKDVHDHASQSGPEKPRRHRTGRLDPKHVEACGHPHLPREPIVNSSLLVGAGYDPDRQVLEAEFHDGGIYRYTGVPLEVYEGIFTAPSVGHYFLNDIKDNYPYECIHRSEYKETQEYLDFVGDHLNIDYIDEDQDLKRAVDEILALGPEVAVSIDFECAIDSYSDKTRGCLRLVQLGVDDPAKGVRKQWVIDCFHADPTPVIKVFQSPQEKLIHYLFFEQDWATSRFGSRINNIFDSCLAWRGVQVYLANALRALDYAQVDKGNVPRAVRRVLGCTVTNREYLSRYRSGDLFGDGDFDDDLVFEIEDKSQVDDEAAREAWLDQDVLALADVTEEENLRVRERVFPRVAELFAKAGYRVERLSDEEVVARLAEPLGVSPEELEGAPAQEAAQVLCRRAVEVRTATLPKLNMISDELREEDPDLAVRLEAENVLIEAERARLKDLRASVPFVAHMDGDDGRGYYAFPDYRPDKRASTAFHPNTLAHLAQSICGFDMPKTEQAGYWGRAVLTSSQVAYAALDVAVLPKIVERTKAVVSDLGIEDEVYRRRIGASQIRVAERVEEKLKKGDYRDHFDKAEIALRRAKTLRELDGAWNSLRQMALVSPSYKRLLRLYKDKKRDIRAGQTRLAPAPAVAAAEPF